MATKPPAFQLYAKDFYMGTAAMSASAVGIYTRLMTWSWDNGPIPSDLVVAGRLALVSPAEFRRHWPAVEAKFILTDAGYINRRLEAVREEQAQFSEGQSQRGKVGAEKRWRKHKQIDSAAIAPPFDLDSSSPTPAPSPSEDQKKKTRAPRSAFADGFEAFWQAYPLKVAKAAAEKAWAKLQPGAELQSAILAAVNAQSADLTFVKDGQVKGTYPASWLNGKRWEDETKTLSILQKHGKEKLLQVARSDPWGMVAECLRYHEGGCTGNDDHYARMQREGRVSA